MAETGDTATCQRCGQPIVKGAFNWLHTLAMRRRCKGSQSYATPRVERAHMEYEEHEDDADGEYLTPTEMRALAARAYDSRPETLQHSLRVGELLVAVIGELCNRAVHHDLSKTQDPEVRVFDEFTPRLKTTAYGSPEYQRALSGMGEGLAHHYAHNRHHPEHFTDGIRGMTLVDVVEMLADWKAATERHSEGDLVKSLAIQQNRFQISDDLAQILRNTADHFGWTDAEKR